MLFSTNYHLFHYFILFTITIVIVIVVVVTTSIHLQHFQRICVQILPKIEFFIKNILKFYISNYLFNNLLFGGETLVFTEPCSDLYNLIKLSYL
jgi:hypothetical protein